MNPWRRLRALPHITLLWHNGGPAGETDFSANTISLRRGMTHDERRCTILHEVMHVQRGAPLDTWVHHEEVRIERACARELLPDIRAVGEALAWGRDLAEAAWELNVDTLTLHTRLRNLHPSERGYLKRRLKDGHSAA